MKEKMLLLEALNIIQLDKNKADFGEVNRAYERLVRFAESNGVKFEDYAYIDPKVR